MSRLAVVAFFIPPIGGGYSERISGFLDYWSRKKDLHVSLFGAEEAGLGMPVDQSTLKSVASVQDIHRLPTLRGRLSFGLLRDGGRLDFVFKILNRLLIVDAHVLWSLCVFISVYRKHRTEKFTSVLTSSAPYSTHLVGVLLKIVDGDVKWVADFRDPWTLNYQLDVVKRNFLRNAQFKIHRRLESYIYRKADKVIVNTHQNLSDVFRVFDVHGDKFKVIQNGYFDSVRNRDRTVCAYTAPDRFKLGFFGGVRGDWYISDLIHILHELKKRWPESYSQLQLVMVGAEKLDSPLAKSLGVSDVFVHCGFQKRDDLGVWLNSMDSLMFVLPGNDGEPLGWVPQRLFMYMASGKPILAVCPTGEAFTYVSESKTGLAFENTDLSEAAEALHLWIDGGVESINFKPDQNWLDRLSKSYLAEEFLKELVGNGHVISEDTKHAEQGL